MREEQWILSIHLDFSKAVDFFSHNIAVGKLRMYKLDEQTVRWTEN